MGNTILLTQSDLSKALKTVEKGVLKTLPPEEATMAEFLPIIFATSREDISKRKPLFVPRAQYLKCAKIRRQVCPAFQDISVDEARAEVLLEANGVPPVLVKNAVHMQDVEYFEPSLLGPASMRDAGSLPQTLSEDVVDDEDKAGASEHNPDESASDSSNRIINPLTEVLPEGSMAAEYLIGINESDGVDSIQQFAVFQEKLKIVQEESTRFLQTEIDKRQCSNSCSDEQMAQAMNQAAAEVKHVQAIVDLQEVAKKMGPKYEERLEEAATASQSKHGTALRINSGKPLDMFDPVSWVISFVEFFYGDCVPNLTRPCPLTWRGLFAYLQRREELEYHLPTDKDDEDIVSSASEHRRYKAKMKSRFDTPEFVALFADNLRRLNILQTTKGFFTKVGKKFTPELQKIAKIKSSDIASLQSSVKSAPTHSLSSWLSVAKTKGQSNVQVALSHLMMHTTNVPLTEGYKMSLRHTGHAMNICDGPLSLFLTVNLADTYSPITLTLLDGAGTPFGVTESKGNDKR